jgi:hypothetical protein
MHWWRIPLRVSVPWSPGATGSVDVPMTGVRRAAGTVSVVLPAALAVVGIVMAVLGAAAAERTGTEAAGTLATELGAALWFGGVLTLGARRGATLGRAAALVALALGGAALVALAWVRDWQGASLALAMELGVGAVAVAVLDVLLLGLVHGGLTRLADSSASQVSLAVQGEAPFVRVRVVRPDDEGTAVGDGPQAP